MRVILSVVVDGIGRDDEPKLHKFICVGGVNKDIKNFLSENIYELFLTEEILEHIIAEINQFNKNYQSFKEISLEELKVYFVMIILMSLVQNPTL